jgi:hypothetical protein
MKLFQFGWLRADVKLPVCQVAVTSKSTSTTRRRIDHPTYCCSNCQLPTIDSGWIFHRCLLLTCNASVHYIHCGNIITSKPFDQSTPTAQYLVPNHTVIHGNFGPMLEQLSKPNLQVETPLTSPQTPIVRSSIRLMQSKHSVWLSLLISRPTAAGGTRGKTWTTSIYQILPTWPNICNWQTKCVTAKTYELKIHE